MIFPRCCFIVVSFILTYTWTNAQAEIPKGPVALAVGGAGVAANDQGEQLFMNPAALSHARGFVTSYFYQDGYLAASERDRMIGVSLIDNGEDVYVSGGFSYTQSDRSFLVVEDYEEERFQISGSKFIYNQVSLGASLVRLSRELESGEDFTFWEGNVGILWNPNPEFALGIVANHVGRHGNTAPAHVRPVGHVVVGTNYVFMPQFRARLDVERPYEENPEDKNIYRLGFESFLDAFFVIRMGAELNGVQERDFFTAGLGFTGPRLRIDYVYKKNTDFSGGALHGVDFRLPF